MTDAQKEKLSKRLGGIDKHGGGFKVNGKEEDADGVLGGLSCLTGAVIEDLLNQLDDAINNMKFRQLPNQYIPDDEGDAPWLDFKVDCGKGVCPVGSRWDRRATDEQKDAEWE